MIPEHERAADDLGAPEEERAAALRASVVAPLEHLGLVAARGDDARAFLQRQLTADLDALDPGHTRLAAWCNPAGRVRLLIRLWQLDGEIHLEAPRERLAAELGRLRMFVLRSKVTLERVEGRWTRLGAAGPEAAEALADRLGLDPPARPDEVRSAAGIHLARLPGARPRYQLLVPAERGGELWRRLGERLRPVGNGAWRLLELAAGIPRVERPAAERHLPQMLGLEALGALSFTKGCFPGQEVIARAHYRGQVKRALTLLRVAAASPGPSPGEPIRDPAGARVGEVLAAEALPGGGWLIAAVCSPGGSVALRLGREPPLELSPYEDPAGGGAEGG